MKDLRFRWSMLFLLSLTLGCRSAPPLPSIDKVDQNYKTARPQQPESPLEPNVLPGGSSEEQGEENQEIAVRILASVNGTPIFAQEVETQAYQYLQTTRRLSEPERSEKQREIRKNVLEQLIEREVVLQNMESQLKDRNPQALRRLSGLANKQFEKTWLRSMMKNNGYKTEKEFEQFLAGQGLPLQTLRRQWVRAFLSREYLRSNVVPRLDKIGHEELYAYYRAHLRDFELKDEVEWQDIFVSTNRHGSKEQAKKIAQQVVDRVKAGEDFVTLCKSYDDGDSVLRQGAGIGRARGEIRPFEVEKILFEMQDGEVGPLVELDTGFHVIRLVKRQRAGRRPFDAKVQEEIRTSLRNGMATREMRQLVEALRARAVIYYADED